MSEVLCVHPGLRQLGFFCRPTLFYEPYTRTLKYHRLFLNKNNAKFLWESHFHLGLGARCTKEGENSYLTYEDKDSNIWGLTFSLRYDRRVPSEGTGKEILLHLWTSDPQVTMTDTDQIGTSCRPNKHRVGITLEFGGHYMSL